MSWLEKRAPFTIRELACRKIRSIIESTPAQERQSVIISLFDENKHIMQLHKSINFEMPWGEVKTPYTYKIERVLSWPERFIRNLKRR